MAKKLLRIVTLLEVDNEASANMLVHIFDSLIDTLGVHGGMQAAICDCDDSPGPNPSPRVTDKTAN